MAKTSTKIKNSNSSGQAYGAGVDLPEIYFGFVRGSSRAVEVAEVISELIELAKQMREANKCGEALNLSEDVCARLRVAIRRIYGYPPDKQEKATQTVLEPAEVIARDWVG